jgi:hypothetical protein
MKFNFYCHKTANLFHFIANLSNWEPHCTQRFNDMWLQETGKLSGEEVSILEKAADLLPSYGRTPQAKTYLPRYFFSRAEADIWRKVKDITSANDFRIMRRAFRVFEPRFDVIWEEEKENLARWSVLLKKYIRDPKLRHLEGDLRTFFDYSKPEPDSGVCLLLSSRNTWGGENLTLGKVPLVVLKCSSVPLDQCAHLIAVLYHEACHSFYERVRKYELLSGIVSGLKGSLPNVPFVTSKQDLSGAIGEAITSNLLPEGYLAHKYLNNPVPSGPREGAKASFASWRLYCAAKMFDLTKDYIEKRKPLDTDYIKRVWETLKDFAKEYPPK